MKKKIEKKLKGFKYYRSKKQILDYMKMPAKDKLRWLEEMWDFNDKIAKQNPKIAKIQEMFRRGEI